MFVGEYTCPNDFNYAIDEVAFRYGFFATNEWMDETCQNYATFI